MPDVSRIRVIAICLFRDGDRLLVLEGFDLVKGTPYYRPLGGAVEFGESTRDAIIREIREEIGQEITDLKLVGVLENLFTCDGKPGHEIVFVYTARFVDESIYRKESFTGTEDGGGTFNVSWRAHNSFDDYHRLVPENLREILNKNSKIHPCPKK